MRAAGAVLWLLLLPASLHANPELVWRIERLTRAIAAAPSEASLYLRRGALERERRDFERALADFERAAALTPGLPGLGLALAQLWLDAGRPERALLDLDRLLAREPGNAHALVLRGRARGVLGDPRAAVADLDAALRRIETPTPELYLERATRLRHAGDLHLDEALAGLDAGIERLGRAYVLVEAAIEIEVERENWTGALARSEGLSAALLRQPEWQARRGDWLRAAGHEAEAQRSYRAALAALHEAAGRRSAQATAALERRLLASLATSPSR